MSVCDTDSGSLTPSQITIHVAHSSEPRARKVEAGASEVGVLFSCIVSEFVASVGWLYETLSHRGLGWSSGEGGNVWPGMLVQTCNPSIWEVERQGILAK